MGGLHRSLLASIDRHNNRAAGAPGYVRFLLDFIPKAAPKKTVFSRANGLLSNRTDD
jgi:hypothetical protein